MMGLLLMWKCGAHFFVIGLHDEPSADVACGAQSLVLGLVDGFICCIKHKLHKI